MTFEVFEIVDYITRLIWHTHTWCKVIADSLASSIYFYDADDFFLSFF